MSLQYYYMCLRGQRSTAGIIPQEPSPVFLRLFPLLIEVSCLSSKLQGSSCLYFPNIMTHCLLYGYWGLNSGPQVCMATLNQRSNLLRRSLKSLQTNACGEAPERCHCEGIQAGNAAWHTSLLPTRLWVYILREKLV